MAHFVNSTASVNAFSFSPFEGVTEGILVAENVPNQRNGGTVYPPHVRCGKFIPLDYVRSPTTIRIGDQCLLTHARLRLVEPGKGRRSFETLASVGRTGVLLLVNLHSTNERIKEKISWLRAWEGIVADDDIEKLLLSDTGALFFFTEEGQVVDVYQANGLVYRLGYYDSSIISIPLTHEEMAEARVEQFRSQIRSLGDTEDDKRRIHGVLAGALRLVRFSAKSSGPREIISRFLSENLGHMTDKLREDIRLLLLEVNDRFAGMFVKDYGGNVVQLDAHRAPVAGDSLKKKQAEAKRRARQDHDREMRNIMRGSSGGGQKKGTKGR